jgi:AcrR family transcriptional regulator
MPKIVDHEQRRREVIGAVVRVITRDGIERCTLRAIARESGHSVGALSHYFADKDDILTSALRLSHERIHARIAERLEPVEGLEAVREFVLDNLPLDEERRIETQLEMTYWSRALSDGDVLAVQRTEASKLREILLDVLRDAIATGAIRDDETAEQVSERLLALIDGLSLHAMLYPERVTAELQADAVDAELARLRPGAPAS